MSYLKPLFYFFLFVSILSLLGGLAHAKNNKIRHKGMDRNHDGVITRQEWRGNNKSFDTHDWNDDGVLTGDEVKMATNQSMSGVNRFNELDNNGNGSISREEWNNTSRSFDNLDRNHNSRLSINEFYNRAVFPVVVFSELDSSNDGWISRSEWQGDAASFNRLDDNTDNYLSNNEFSGRQGMGIIEQVFQEIFRKR